jgi:hypothetical protein
MADNPGENTSPETQPMQVEVPKQTDRTSSADNSTPGQGQGQPKETQSTAVADARTTLASQFAKAADADVDMANDVPRVEKGPYRNENPRATADEQRIGARLQESLPEEVWGAPEVKGQRSGDYRFELSDGSVVQADLYQPQTGNLDNLSDHIMEKSGQCKVAVVEFGAGKTATMDVREAKQIADDVLGTPGHGVERLIFVKNDQIILDRS